VNFHVYSYGALALVCAGLYAWALIESKSAETVAAKLKAKETELTQAQADLARAVQVNTDNITQIGILKADLKTQSDLAVKFDALARTRADKLNAALKEIADAPDTDDGPVAPVLARELDRLRRDYAEATGHHQDPDRAAAAPGQ
jgi:hypothetical protein